MAGTLADADALALAASGDVDTNLAAASGASAPAPPAVPGGVPPPPPPPALTETQIRQIKRAKCAKAVLDQCITVGGGDPATDTTMEVASFIATDTHKGRALEVSRPNPNQNP